MCPRCGCDLTPDDIGIDEDDVDLAVVVGVLTCRSCTWSGPSPARSPSWAELVNAGRTERTRHLRAV